MIIDIQRIWLVCNVNVSDILHLCCGRQLRESHDAWLGAGDLGGAASAGRRAAESRAAKCQQDAQKTQQRQPQSVAPTPRQRGIHPRLASIPHSRSDAFTPTTAKKKGGGGGGEAGGRKPEQIRVSPDLWQRFIPFY